MDQSSGVRNTAERKRSSSVACCLRWEWAESQVSRKSQWKRRVRIWTLAKSQVFCHSSPLDPAEGLKSVWYLLALAVSWSVSFHWTGCKTEDVVFLALCLLISSVSPLNGSHWIGAGLKHHQQHSSFGSVKVNELTVMGLRVLAFTSSFYSSVLKSTINKDVLKVLSLDAVSFPYCLKKSKQWCSYLIMSSCYHMTSNINWKGKIGTSAWLNILESNNCVHFIAPCSPARGEKLFPSSFQPNQTIHHVVRFSCEQHSSTRWNNTLC